MTPDRQTTHPVPFGVLTWLALAASASALVFVLSAFLPVARAALTPSPADPLTLTEQAQRVRAYNASFEHDRAQITGRSLFFIPPNPPPKPEPRPEPREEKEPPPPPPPSRYGGPKPIAVVFDQVWFQDGRKLRVGETSRELEVISNDGAPWSVVLRWEGVEFDVQLLEKTTDRLLEDVGEQTP